MESLTIEGEKYTPSILFDTQTNIFEIRGESYSEYSEGFYQPIVEWLHYFLEANQKPIILNFHLIYFNTSSSRSLFEILEILEEYHRRTQVSVNINWYAKFNDLDMIEDGENYKENFETLSFNVVRQPAS